MRKTTAERRQNDFMETLAEVGELLVTADGAGKANRMF
jgi:hypothetical protein